MMRIILSNDDAERLRATLEADPARLADALSDLPAHLVKTDARDGDEVIFGEFTGLLRRRANQADSGLRVEDTDGCVLLLLEDE